jgi:two-component system, LuxR family, sensor kinase FixL
MRLEPLGERAGVQQLRARASFAPVVERAAMLAALACAYFLASKIGLELSLHPSPISTLWPPNALLLAALLLTAPTHWWLLVASVFPAHMLVQIGADVPPAMAFLWFVTNSLEALIGAGCAFLLLGATPRLERLRDLAVFLAVCVVLAPFLSSLIDAAAVKIVGWGEGGFWPLWRLRFFSNALAILVLVPVILHTARTPLRWPSIAMNWRLVEALLLTVTLCGLCLVAFSYVETHYDIVALILYALLPLLLWAALRFGSAYLSNLILIIALLAIWGAQHARGPLILDSPAENALALQLFLIFTAAPLLILAAVVHEWREAGQQARDNEEQLNLALQAAQMCSWSWDVRANRVRWSTSSLAGFVKLEELTDLAAFLQLVHPSDRERAEIEWRTAACDRRSYEIEYRALRTDGSYGWIASRATPRFDASGRMTYMLGLNADISERRAEAAQIRQQRDELAHLSRVAMVGELSGAVAHELNQPLTAILCNAQAAQRLLRHASPDEIGLSEILGDIVSENKRAGEIIRRLRELLKKGEVQLLPVDINNIVREVIVLEHSDMVARNIVITTQLGSDVPLALADRVQLQQVLLNLIINAADAMHANQLSERLITIRSHRAGADFVRIAVKDCGPGIPVDPSDQIFEPFYTTKAHGLGLGLTICRSIIAAHHGRLWAVNNDDGGATLLVELPVAKQ